MTGAEESTARNVLEASNWDLNDAITLHFASQEAGGAGGFGAAAAPPAAAAGGAGDWGASGGVGDDGMDEATRAAIAAAQAEMAVDSTEVRKADDHIEDQLFDPAQVRAMQRMETAQLKKIAVADPFRDLNSGEASKGGLGDIFKTPDALTFKGGFEEAREAAEKSGKLLMVNIQDEQEFASHMLVRRHALVLCCTAYLHVCISGFVSLRRWILSESLYCLRRTAIPGPCQQYRISSNLTLSFGSSTCQRRRARHSSTFTKSKLSQW